MRIIGFILAGVLITPVALAQKAVVAEVSSVASDTSARQRALNEATDLISSGQPQRALDEKLIPLIREYESTPRRNNIRTYSVRTSKEGLEYAWEAKAQNKTALILDESYGYAYYLSAFAHSELKHLDEAEALLRKALEISPMNSQFLGQLGYYIRKTGDNIGSIEMFKRAEAATAFSPEPLKISERTRALRGQGYALIQLDRLDEAEAVYKTSLKLDPEDQESKNGLEYIRQQRAKH